MLPSDSNDKQSKTQDEQFSLEDIQRAIKVFEFIDRKEAIQKSQVRGVTKNQRLENEVADILRSEYGQNIIRMQVQCGIGIIDIMTEDYICEVKTILDRTSIFQAIGQVLLYRESIKPKKIPMIAGIVGKKQTCIEWEQHLANIGIKLLPLTNERLE